MPSDSGSPEPLSKAQDEAAILHALLFVTPEERDRIADGEPYCFRCGKPASSFEAYDEYACQEEAEPGHRAQQVRDDEGTYNPDTNRFACDGCYIAIGMPSTNTIEGWKAP